MRDLMRGLEAVDNAAIQTWRHGPTPYVLAGRVVAIYYTLPGVCFENAASWGFKRMGAFPVWLRAGEELAAFSDRVFMCWLDAAEESPESLVAAAFVAASLLGPGTW